jgi:hypothetical protein
MVGYIPDAKTASNSALSATSLFTADCKASTLKMAFE